MAKTYVAQRPFDVGGDPLTHYEPGDKFPADSDHVKHLVDNGYIADSETVKGGTPAASEGPVDPSTGLPPKDAEVYQQNEGSVADAAGAQIDVVGEGTPDAEDVQKQKPAARAKSAAKKSTAKRSTAKRTSARKR